MRPLVLQIALEVQYPVAVQKAYENSLKALVKAIYNVLAQELVSNTQFTSGYKSAIRRDSFNDDFQELITFCELKITIQLKNFTKNILSTAGSINLFNKKAVLTSFKNTIKKDTLGINLKSPATKDMRAVWVSENVRLIKSIGQNSLKDVEQIVYSAIRQGASYKELSKNLAERFTVAKKRANIIARDQINKLNAGLTRARHQELGINLFKWSTSGDERVRLSHKVLNSKICKYSDVDLYKDHMNTQSWLKRSSISATLSQPGQDVLCRCTAIAVLTGQVQG